MGPVVGDGVGEKKNVFLFVARKSATARMKLACRQCQVGETIGRIGVAGAPEPGQC